MAIRAEAFYKEFQQRFDLTGPMLKVDDFSDLIRQSFSIELDDLITEPELTYYLSSETNSVNSIVSEMSKDDLMERLEDSAVNSRSLDIAKLEYDEAVGNWIAVVRSWLEAIGGGQADLFQVIEGTGMSPVMVWMALLIGDFEMENQGDFYQGGLGCDRGISNSAVIRSVGMEYLLLSCS